MITLTSFVEAILAMPVDAAAFAASRRLSEIYPDYAVIQLFGWEIDLTNYLRYSGVEWTYLPNLHVHFGGEVDGRELRIEPRNAMISMSWRGQLVRAMVIAHDCELVFIVADSERTATDLIREVRRFAQATAGEVLVFAEGCLSRDRDIDRQVACADLGDLTLSPGIERAVNEQVLGFFDAKDSYTSYGVPWKRGVLFTGPPGNGKTQTIKAIANRLRRPVLYVRSFDSPRRYGGSSESEGIRSLFKNARRAAPCILVLEDLDSLVSKDVLSVFLNEMDGLSANEGLLTIATTNHPQKLDPALRNRPSRFDRTIEFTLPARSERLRYIQRTTSTWDETARMSESGAEKASVASAGLSFASLKEACLSAMMAWIAKDEARDMNATLLDQIIQLSGGRKKSRKQKRES